MSEALDVIVVGAGPAGSSCARRAAERGLSVTVLEKCTFPRFKPCGGGLTEKALRLLNGELCLETLSLPSIGQEAGRVTIDGEGTPFIVGDAGEINFAGPVHIREGQTLRVHV